MLREIFDPVGSAQEETRDTGEEEKLSLFVLHQDDFYKTDAE